MNHDEPRQKETKQCFLVTLSILIPPYERPQKQLCSHSHQNCFVGVFLPALGISVLQPGTEATPLQWKHWTTREGLIKLVSDTYQKIHSEQAYNMSCAGVPKVRTWFRALKLQSLFSASASSCLDLNLSIRSKATPIKQAVTGLTRTVWKYTSRVTEKNYSVPGWLTELEIRWWGVEIVGILILGRRALQRYDNSSKFLKDWVMVPFTLWCPHHSGHTAGLPFLPPPLPCGEIRAMWLVLTDRLWAEAMCIIYCLGRPSQAHPPSTGEMVVPLPVWVLEWPWEETHPFLTHHRYVDNPEIKL